MHLENLENNHVYRIPVPPWPSPLPLSSLESESHMLSTKGLRLAIWLMAKPIRLAPPPLAASSKTELRSCHNGLRSSHTIHRNQAGGFWHAS